MVECCVHTHSKVNCQMRMGWLYSLHTTLPPLCVHIRFFPSLVEEFLFMMSIRYMILDVQFSTTENKTEIAQMFIYLGAIYKNNQFQFVLCDIAKHHSLGISI